MRKKRIKNVVKQVFLTQEENARLLALMAEEEETNFSAYARKKLFNNELASWTVSFPEYEPMTEHLIQIGRSLNAIAKLSTQVGTISQQDFIELGQLVTQLMEELERELSVNPGKSRAKNK
ncbi:transposase [Streptococcus ruminantium]|uniref:transposase n=1 Tax=Streptococcus ruminantium TaxID=1917441 RepID=UPI0012DF492F|nr:transposase [Streptococcus ruminantium]